jgi:hypothetical protein
LDYGYRLLRHVTGQVFGNLGQAAQLTITPLLISGLLAALVWFLALLTVYATGQTGAARIILVGTAVVVPVLIISVLYCWAAVGWHRYVLLSETGDGLFPPWTGRPVRTYFARTFLVVMVIFLAVATAILVLGLVLSVAPSQGATIYTNISLTFLASWIAVRFGLVLPAGAMGQPMSLLQSWKVSRPVSGHMLLPIVVFAIAFEILRLANGYLFAVNPKDGVFFLQFGRGSAPLGVPGILVFAILAWLQMLLNLALLTTLYGNLVEGRALR